MCRSHATRTLRRTLSTIAWGVIAALLLSGCALRAEPLMWESTWTPITEGAYPRLARLRDGTLLLTFDRKQGDQSIVGMVRSTDGGRRWSDPVTVAAHPRSDDVANAFPLELADGTIVVAFRHHTPDRKVYRLELIASTDGGATWQPRSTIARGTVGLWEPFLLELPDGMLHAYYASEEGIFPDQRIEMRASDDGGRSWGPPTTVAGKAKSRDGMPGVVRLGDGTLLAVFEASDLPPFRFVIRAIRSRDDGRTWSSQRQLVVQPWDPAPARWAAAAPYVVVVRPGHLMTSYQTDEDVAHAPDDPRADPAHPDYEYLHHTRLKYVESLDGGRTWRVPIALTGASQTPSNWNALYVPRPGTVIALSGFKGRIWTRHATARE